MELGAQNDVSNIRTKVLSPAPDSVLLDTLSIVYNSVSVYYGQQLLNAGYRINYLAKTIVFNKDLQQKTLTVVYRVLFLPASQTFFHKPKYLIEPVFNGTPRYYYSYSNPNNSNQLFSDGLNVNGNIARGIGFGNNQDVVLNSNLNLQLSGNLGKGISILAAISDENNPIQPEGNTQQIQDFDKVFISILKIVIH